MKRNSLFTAAVLVCGLSYSQTGINTNNPQRTLHVNGSVQVTNELNLGGDGDTPGSAGSSGQVLISNGGNQAPSWQTLAIPTIPSLATGTVIAVDGQLMIAQEITVQMTADFVKPSGGEANPIGNLDQVIIDNETTYSGAAAGNSFTVSSDGVYQVTMNLQLVSNKSNQPVIGIWDDVLGSWVARVNDHFSAENNQLQTYTLITAIPLEAGKAYSFRVASTGPATIRAFSSGSTGSGPVSQVTLKRLK